MNEFFSKKTLYIVLACCVLGGVYGFVSGFAGARNPAKMRATALEVGTKTCVTKAQQVLTGKNIPGPAIDAYCKCAVQRSADALTDDQLDQIGRGKSTIATALGQPRYTAIINACQAEALPAR